MSKPSKRRFIVPGVLIAAGLAGFGLAAASELDLDWGGTFQAGAVKVAADCQEPGTAINVNFSAPNFDAARSTAPWSFNALTFSGVSTTCVDTKYEVAIRTSENGTWTKVGNGDVNGTSIPVTLASNVKAETITDVALTMHKPAS